MTIRPLPGEEIGLVRQIATNLAYVVTQSMNITGIFKVFSKRSQEAKAPSKQLTYEFRQRAVRLLSSGFPIYQSSSLGLGASISDLWWELREGLLYLHGLGTLSGNPNTDPGKDVLAFLSECKDDYFLDAIELAFQSHFIRGAIHVRTGKPFHVDEMIDSINQFFDVDELPYYLTGFIYGKFGITAFPQVIRRDSGALHQTAIAPTLSLLSQPVFAAANEEVLEALKDFRAADYGDCVVKCGSSLESVMKIICDKKGWPYDQKDTAGVLLKHILPHTSLDSYFEQPIMLIATIRNRLSTAHGAGTQQKSVSKHVASYVINATASAILLLVDETNP